MSQPEKSARDAHGYAKDDLVRLSPGSGIVSAVGAERSVGKVVEVLGRVLLVAHADGTTSRYDAATVERAPRP